MFTEKRYSYSMKDLMSTSAITSSSFDDIIMNSWRTAEETDALNYSVKNVITKVLEGDHKIVAQVCVFS